MTSFVTRLHSFSSIQEARHKTAELSVKFPQKVQRFCFQKFHGKLCGFVSGNSMESSTVLSLEILWKVPRFRFWKFHGTFHRFVSAGFLDCATVSSHSTISLHRSRSFQAQDLQSILRYLQNVPQLDSFFDLGVMELHYKTTASVILNLEVFVTSKLL